MGCMTTKPTYGQRIRAIREAHGMSLATLHDELLLAIPRRYVPSTKQLQRIETDEITEQKVDGIVVYGIARVLDCKVRDISEVVADELDRLSDLLERQSRCIPDCDPVAA